MIVGCNQTNLFSVFPNFFLWFWFSFERSNLNLWLNPLYWTIRKNISTVCSSLQCSHLASIFVCHVLLLPPPPHCLLALQQNWVNSELIFTNRWDGSDTRCYWGSTTPRLQTKRIKVTFASEPADERVRLTRHAASACFDYVQSTSLNLCCCSEEATAWYCFGRCFSHRRCEVGVWRGRGWSVVADRTWSERGWRGWSGRGWRGWSGWSRCGWSGCGCGAKSGSWPTCPRSPALPLTLTASKSDRLSLWLPLTLPLIDSVLTMKWLSIDWVFATNAEF